METNCINRLTNVLNILMDKSQTSFVKYRFISENTKLIYRRGQYKMSDLQIFKKKRIFFSYFESTYPAASYYQLPLFTNQSEMALFKKQICWTFKVLDSLEKIDFLNHLNSC